MRGLLHTCFVFNFLTARLSHLPTLLDRINPVVWLSRQNDENRKQTVFDHARVSVCLVGIFSTAFALVAPTSSMVTAVKTLQDYSTPHSYGWS